MEKLGITCRCKMNSTLWRSLLRTFSSASSILASLAFSPIFLVAQPATMLQHPAEIRSVAVAGEPFGVGQIIIPLGSANPDLLPRIFLQENANRIFYPAIISREGTPPPRVIPLPPTQRRIGGGALIERLKGAVNSARQQSQPFLELQIDFLFVGDKPLDISIDGFSLQPVPIVLTPVTNANSDGLQPDPKIAYQTWYKSFAGVATKQIANGDYPPVFQTFLVETLARRLKFQAIDLRSQLQQQPVGETSDPLATPQSTLELLASSDTIRDQMFQQTLRQPAQSFGAANVPLPAPPQWDQLPVPSTPEDLPIESIAAAVPQDCFYLRFGRFSNYLWFRTLTAGKGAGLGQMLTIRGSDSFANTRIEKMLSTKTTLLAKLFGDAIIGDMAIIGNDLYLQDGASMGVLLEATNVGQLQSSIDGERKQFAKSAASEGVQLDILQIAGRNVTLLSNRDHTVRSYRVVDGNLLFICTSQHLIEDFLSVRDGAASLANLPEFRYGRLLMPVKNQYELFGYFSSKFFQRLISPHYNIELHRRYAAKARIAAAEMADLMATAEGVDVDSIPNLIDANFLPTWFNNSGDGSQIIRQSDRWVDSRRGGLGGFLPITDVPLLDCTSQESQQYQRDAAFYSANWKSTEPMLFGLRRFESTLSPEVEQIAIEAHVTSLEAEKLGKIGKYLAPPVDTIITTPPDDLVSFQVHMAGQNILGSHSPNNVLFAGLKDSLPPQPTKEKRLLEIWRAVNQTPFYIGAWPLPGYLDQLPLGLGGSRTDLQGYSRALLGMWRWQGSGFSVISFDRSILDQAVAYLQPVVAPDPAQVRVLVRDLENTKLSNWVNTFWYRRAFAASRGNLKLLDSMQEQFHLTPDEAKQSAEKLLDTKLVCPLGGRYTLEPAEGAKSRWTSTALQSPKASTAQPVWDVMQVDLESLYAPTDYRADWIGWMRGLQAHLTQTQRGLSLIATADVQRLELKASPSESMTLPPLDFNLFNLPSQLFGGKLKGDSETTKEQRDF